MQTKNNKGKELLYSDVNVHEQNVRALMETRATDAFKAGGLDKDLSLPLEKGNG